MKPVISEAVSLLLETLSAAQLQLIRTALQHPEEFSELAQLELYLRVHAAPDTTGSVGTD